MQLTHTGLEVKHSDHLNVVRAGLGTIFLASSTLLYQIIILDQERGILFVSQKWTAAFGLGILGASLSLFTLAISWSALGERLAQSFERLLNALQRLRLLNLVLFWIPMALYGYLLLGPQGYLFDDLITRMCLFGTVVFVGAVFLKATRFLDGWLQSGVVSWIFMAVVYKIATIPDLVLFFIPEVVGYPFSLGWSEASRYYYASLFFAERVYGVAAQVSVLHPSRYLLQSIPFLFDDLPLWVHRLWQVMLWLLFSGGTVFLLARRLRIGKAWLALAFGAWSFLFLFQGPVYYHLLVVAMIVIWGFDSHRFWRSLVIVLIASAWAGISRINWFPVPGLLAAVIYFLEVPVAAAGEESEADVRRWRVIFSYLAKPAIWFGLGTLTAFGAQALYVLWSGVDARLFISSFTSDLLWYRLWPNPTYPLGILPAALLVTAPLLMVLVFGLRDLHPLRLVGIGTALMVLFVGGIVVSTKIGGGSNLHNLDAFLTLLLVVGSYVFFGRVEPASSGFTTSHPRITPLLLALNLLVPVAFVINQGGPVSLPDEEQVEGALATLEQLSGDAVEKGGEVLFISQRHLLTFDILPGVPLLEKYENVFLMEMAMSGNEHYLTSFYDDLGHHRFALIISDQQGNRLKGSEQPFGEENDVWVKRVTRPLLEHYQRKDLLKRFGIEVLEPRR